MSFLFTVHIAIVVQAGGLCDYHVMMLVLIYLILWTTIFHIYSSNNHVEMVQFMIRNAKLSVDTANYVLQWAST